LKVKTMETEEEDRGAGVVRTSPIKIARPITKNVSYPVLCKRCTGLHTVQDGGPDSGRVFTCGICIENMTEGNMSFSCPYFCPTALARIEDKVFCNGTCMCQPEYEVGACRKPISAIIDADKANEALRAVALLKKRPIIIEEPSPHDFIDAAIRKLEQENQELKYPGRPAEGEVRCFLCGRVTPLSMSHRGCCWPCWNEAHS
jgi:hypothetical protein